MRRRERFPRIQPHPGSSVCPVREDPPRMGFPRLMAGVIEFTKDPASRDPAVLLDLLKITQTLTEQKIEAVICGGWVPFLKELAEHSQTAHSMNLDIDSLACEGARARGHRSHPETPVRTPGVRTQRVALSRQRSVPSIATYCR